MTPQLVLELFAPLASILTAMAIAVAFLRTVRTNAADIWQKNSDGFEKRSDLLEKLNIDLTAANHDLRLDLEKERSKSAQAAASWATERGLLLRRIADLESDRPAP